MCLLGEFRGLRNPAGYSPWICKQSDTTERLIYVQYTKQLDYRVLLSDLKPKGKDAPLPPSTSIMTTTPKRIKMNETSPSFGELVVERVRIRSI